MVKVKSLALNGGGEGGGGEEDTILILKTDFYRLQSLVHDTLPY